MTSARSSRSEQAPTWPGRCRGREPKYLLSQARATPGIKQFLQFCLVLMYPAWLFMVLIAWPVWLVGKALEGVLWVLFWPVRATHKKNNPEEYAAFQAEQAAKKEARSRPVRLLPRRRPPRR